MYAHDYSVYQKPSHEPLSQWHIHLTAEDTRNLWLSQYILSVVLCVILEVLPVCVLRIALLDRAHTIT